MPFAPNGKLMHQQIIEHENNAVEPTSCDQNTFRFALTFVWNNAAVHRTRTSVKTFRHIERKRDALTVGTFGVWFVLSSLLLGPFQTITIPHTRASLQVSRTYWHSVSIY